MPSTPDPDLPSADGIAYTAAVAELEALLTALERDDVDVDVDQLAADVARAADLIRVCRARIERARVDVERIVADLDLDT